VLTTEGGDSSEPLLLDVRATAKLLCISERTLWRLRKDGVLPAVKILGTVRFRRGDIQQYVAGLEAG